MLDHITWGEFKRLVEEAGTLDSDTVEYIFTGDGGGPFVIEVGPAPEDGRRWLTVCPRFRSGDRED